MLANLMPVPTAPPRAEESASASLQIHPRYRTWLARCGLQQMEDFLWMNGTIVAGHPDRHTLRVTLAQGRRAFLKREHLVPWPVLLQNRWQGSKARSRSAREAAILIELEQLGLPGPEWLAFGESARGEAFLLLADLGEVVEFNSYLRNPTRTMIERANALAALGTLIARYHGAGVQLPDLSAKHVLVDRQGMPVIVDWANARRRPQLTGAQRARDLQRLMHTARLSRRDALRLLQGYISITQESLAQVARLARPSRRTSRRSSAAYQRDAVQPAPEWVWHEHEACVLRADLSDAAPELTRADFGITGSPLDPADALITLPEATRVRVLFHTDGLVRPTAWERATGRIWRSRLMQVVDRLVRLERFAAPTPRVVAFGQWRRGLGGQAFLALEEEPPTYPVASYWPTASLEERRQLLFQFGVLVRAFADAGLRLPLEWLRITTELVPCWRVQPPVVEAWSALARRPQPEVTMAAARALLDASGTDFLRMVRGYTARQATPRKMIQRVLRTVRQLSGGRA
ncbi:MAG: lipopolysaccharide kinase InaA family protein [Gemmataceae bacterium]